MISLLTGQWNLLLIGIPLVMFNFYQSKNEKVHFVTSRDFEKVRSHVRNVFYGKTLYYAGIFIASVVMFIISIVRLLHVIL